LIPSKAERLAEFLRRLEAAPAATDLDSARHLIEETLNAVENEMTDIPFDPAAWETDGRMYPAQDDQVRSVAGRPDLRRLVSRGHDTFLRDNGAISIRERRTKQVLLRKRGADGRGVDDE
jgi:hypothetical protein